jgi:type IVB pilus formation R64 PilN family outer membrane protein
MIKKQLLQLLIVLVTVSILTACNPPPQYNAISAKVEQDKNKIGRLEEQHYNPPAPVVTETGPYVDTKPISLIREPLWLKQKVAFSGSRLPFSFYASKIVESTGALAYYDDSVDKNKTLSLQYNGTARGALDELSSAMHYHYNVDYKQNVITWSAYETTVFDVAFMPGTTDYLLGQDSGGSTGISSGSSSAEYVGLDSSDSQFSKMTGSLSIWKDMEATIKNLMSKEGSVSVSQATTSVTVRDHPQNVKAVAAYLEKLNKELSKQVRIHVQVLEVNLSNAFSYGIDWGVVRNAGQHGSKTWKLSAPLATNTLPGSTGTALTLGYAVSGEGGRYRNTNTIIQALEEQGKVRVVTQPSVVTLNNQVARLAITGQTSYIAEIATTQSDQSTETSVTPGVVTDGFTLYVLPKIRDDKVYLQITSSIANLQGIQTIDTSTGKFIDPSTPSDEDTSSDKSSSVIQVPTLSSRDFNQRSMIKSGDTLILAGFKELQSKANKSKFLWRDELGGSGGSVDNVEMVVLITPSILNDGETF